MHKGKDGGWAGAEAGGGDLGRGKRGIDSLGNLGVEGGGGGRRRRRRGEGVTDGVHMMAVRGPNNETYEEYYYRWSEGQQQYCKALRDGLNGDMREGELRELVDKVMKHYEEYYLAKDGAAKQDVLKMMHPTWRSPLETAFLWIGGWRPTMVFQLAYAQAGQEIEAEMAEFLNGLDTPTMASLSAKQLSQISDLQVQTQRAEDELGHREAIIQQSLADQPLLKLAQAEFGESSSDGGGGGGGLEHQQSLTDALDEKVKALEELLRDADDLRVECLSEFLRILTTTQAAQYLVAAGQLHMAVREIGLKRHAEVGSPDKPDSPGRQGSASPVR